MSYPASPTPTASTGDDGPEAETHAEARNGAVRPESPNAMTIRTRRDASRPYYADDAVTIWHGNALDLPIPDESVDLIVTSPPYFGLRSYTDGGEHYGGQIGSEATPGEFVDALIAATAEMVRVLKPSGSLWLNLGDKYSSGGRTSYDVTDINGARGGVRAADGARPKTLLGLPWRYAIRCVDELGLILRAEVVWSKPNGLPESVTDRVRRSHEQWFHFTREPRYFSAVDEIREGYAPETAARYTSGYNLTGAAAAGQSRNAKIAKSDGGPSETNPLGKLPGSVWEVPTQPLKVPAHLGIDHFAAFPMEWPRRLIRGWSPSGICVECGEGRRPVAATNGVKTPEKWHDVLSGGQRTRVATGGGATGLSLGVPASAQQRTITGYICACAAPTAPTRPAVILDPFGGTGTTALVARALGRTGWHVDLSADYCRLAQWRVTDPSELARALQVEKPPATPDGMDSLLDLIEGGAA